MSRVKNKVNSAGRGNIPFLQVIDLRMPSGSIGLTGMIGRRGGMPRIKIESYFAGSLALTKQGNFYLAWCGKKLLMSAIMAAVSFSVLISSVFGSELTRVPVDSVGYALTPGQMDEVARVSESRILGSGGFPVLPAKRMIGGICPHDDHIYAGQTYLALTRNIDVPLVVIIGVSHAARRSGIMGKIVFDRYMSWRGPYGDVAVSSIREGVKEALPGEIVLISNELHRKEHSIEGIIPFLQYSRRVETGKAKDGQYHSGFEILPILVTFLPGESFDSAVEELSRALYAEFEARDMILGRDYIVLISSDCVHYGDEGWGGRDHAPFGTGKEGYEKAVSRDMEIVRQTLTGAVTTEKIGIFRDRVDSYEFEWPYKIPWCGVYSIPFGLSLLCRLSEMEGRELPDGVMIDYSTTLDPGSLDFVGERPGATNIASLRHWVGFVSVGYW